MFVRVNTLSSGGTVLGGRTVAISSMNCEIENKHLANHRYHQSPNSVLYFYIPYRQSCCAELLPQSLQSSTG